MRKTLSLTLTLTLALTSLAACGGDDDPSPCESACAKATAANCPDDDPQAVCVQDCNSVVALDPTCADEANAWISCVAAGSWVCVGGSAEPQANCDAQETALIACLTAAGAPQDVSFLGTLAR